MTALSDFFEKQKTYGRTAAVAACTLMVAAMMASPVFGQDAQTFKVVQDINGKQVEETLPRAKLRDVLQQMNTAVSQDLMTVGNLNADLDKIGASRLSIDQKITEIKKVATASLRKLDEDKALRLSHKLISVSSDSDPVNEAELLATRSNRLVEFTANVSMTLQAMLVALNQHDTKGIDQAYRALDKLYGEQMSIEAGMGQIGFSVTEALKQVR